MKSYDLVYVVRPDLEADALKAVVDRLTQRIQDQGGAVERVDVWGKRRMSYVVRKHREGIFVHTRFSVEPGKVQEIRRAVALTEDVLRATLTQAVGKLPEPAAAAAAAPVPPVPPAAATPPAAGVAETPAEA